MVMKLKLTRRAYFLIHEQNRQNIFYSSILKFLIF